MKQSCSLCEGAFAYNAGYKGSRADEHKILLVLHRSDSRALTPTLFADEYRTALARSQTGRVLGTILKQASLGLEDVFVTNAFKCLLPGDREPTAKQYGWCRSELERQHRLFSPEKVVVFGLQPYWMIGGSQQTIDEAAGDVIDWLGSPALVMFHPGYIWKFPEKKKWFHINQVASYLR